MRRCGCWLAIVGGLCLSARAEPSWLIGPPLITPPSGTVLPWTDAAQVLPVRVEPRVRAEAAAWRCRVVPVPGHNVVGRPESAEAQAELLNDCGACPCTRTSDGSHARMRVDRRQVSRSKVRALAHPKRAAQQSSTSHPSLLPSLFSAARI